jgi:hypothetical protein
MKDQRKWIEEVPLDALIETPYLGLEKFEVESFFEGKSEARCQKNALLPEDCSAATRLEEEIYRDAPGHIKGYQNLLGLVASCYIASAVRNEPYLCFKATRGGELSAYVIAIYGDAERTKGRFFNDFLSREFGRLQCVYVSDWQAKSKWGGGSVARSFFQSYGEVLSVERREVPVLAHARVATSFSTVVQNTPLLTSFTNRGMHASRSIEALHVHSVSDINRSGEALRGIIISSKKIGPDETGPKF